MKKEKRTREEIELEIEKTEKQLYFAQSEDTAKKGTKMGEILIDSFRGKIKSLYDELKDIES